MKHFKITKAGECEGKFWLNGQHMYVAIICMLGACFLRFLSGDVLPGSLNAAPIL